MGGHCLPVDPFYLAFKAREARLLPRVHRARRQGQPGPARLLRDRIARALNEAEKAVKGSRVLILGVSYKAGVGDIRESPALKIIAHAARAGAEVSYHDPYVPELREFELALGRPRRGGCARPTWRRSSPPTRRSTTRRWSPRRR